MDHFFGRQAGHRESVACYLPARTCRRNRTREAERLGAHAGVSAVVYGCRALLIISKLTKVATQDGTTRIKLMPIP